MYQGFLREGQMSFEITHNRPHRHVHRSRYPRVDSGIRVFSSPVGTRLSVVDQEELRITCPCGWKGNRGTLTEFGTCPTCRTQAGLVTSS